MNRIKTEDDNIVKMWLSPALEPRFREFFEIEMLQGIRRVEADGTIFFQFETTPDKVEILKKVLLQHISGSDKLNLN